MPYVEACHNWFLILTPALPGMLLHYYQSCLCWLPCVLTFCLCWLPLFLVGNERWSVDCKSFLSSKYWLFAFILIVSFLWPDNKHSNVTNFSDKPFKDDLHFKLLRKPRTASGPHNANCLGSSGFKFNIPFMNPWTIRCLLKNISLSMASYDDRANLAARTDSNNLVRNVNR